MKQLNENDTKKNLKQVFQASDKEKIVRVLDFTDFIKRESLDQLSIMTYLFQLRDHFDPEKTKLMSPTKTNNPILNLSPINKPITPVLTTPNKQFMNPFDSDEEDVNNNLLKTKSGLIKIKPNKLQLYNKKNYFSIETNPLMEINLIYLLQSLILIFKKIKEELKI